MEIAVAMSASPAPPQFLPEIAENYTHSSPVPTQSVACFTDSATDMVFAAFQKEVDKLRTFPVADSNPREEPLICLQVQVQYHRLVLEQTQQLLQSKTHANKSLDRMLKTWRILSKISELKLTLWKKTELPFPCFMIWRIIFAPVIL